MTCEEYQKRFEEHLHRVGSNEESENLPGWQQHMADCANCRQWSEEALEVDRRMRRALSITDLSSRIAAIDVALARELKTLPSQSRGPNVSTRVQWLSYAATILVVIGSSFWLARQFDGHLAHRENVVSELGMVANTIGEVLIQSPNENSWLSCSMTEPIVVHPESRIRTTDSALCEITTTNGTNVRLKSNTECILHSEREATIIQGTMWVSASTDTFAVKGEGLATATSEEKVVSVEEERATQAVFACASGPTFQCESAGSQMTCYGMGTSPIRVQVANQTFQMPPSGKLLIDATRKVDEDGQDSILEVTNSEHITSMIWQLPLLSGSDFDVKFLGQVLELIPDERVFQSKAFVGDFKLQIFVDSQIRQMGPLAAKPLLSFVESERSQANPMSRRRAMQLGAELADENCLEVLQRLREDVDTSIARIAERGIEKLQSEATSVH